MKPAYSNSIKWSIFIFILTFVLACIFSVTSTIILEGVGWGAGMFIVFVIMLVGIVFDMMGIASTAAREAPFNAMAAARVRGARHALMVVRSADRFSNFCNDVVGDVCGIISGAASAIVILKLLQAAAVEGQATAYTAVTVLFTALVSAMTVGGKALGKTFAITHSTQIMLLVGKLFHFLERRLGMKLLGGRKNKGNKGKRGRANASGQG
jgi:CBS domain containing-hemolysin-like protein